MRIAITGPVSVSGVSGLLDDPVKPLPVGNTGAPILTTLIRALLERGHEVSAYTLDRGMAMRGESLYMANGRNGFRLYVGPYRNHSFRPSHGRPGRMLNVFGDERRALLDIIQRDNPDVIHAHWTYEYALAAIASGKPHVITAHDSPLQVLRFLPNFYRMGRYFMARSVFRRARVLTAVSPYLKTQVQRYTRVPISVIGNPVPNHALEIQKISDTRKSRQNQPMIAMVLSGWGRRKNAATGLRAFALLRNMIPGAILHCFGFDYGSGEQAEVWCQRHGLADGVRFNGAIPHDELLDRLGGIDMLLHPALEESFGLTLLEAMAVGVPVVGGEKSGGVPWVLDEGRAGMLVNVKSPEAICGAMQTLLRDYDSCLHMVDAATQRVRSLFTPSAVARQYEDLYKSALSNQ